MVMLSESETKFWRLLAGYETLTYQQAVFVRDQNFPLFTQAQPLKSTLFTGWLSLGSELGITRATDPELDARLKEIQILEDENRHHFEAGCEFMRLRLEELVRVRVRLRHVRAHYQPLQNPGAAKAFVARG